MDRDQIPAQQSTLFFPREPRAPTGFCAALPSPLHPTANRFTPAVS